MARYVIAYNVVRDGTVLRPGEQDIDTPLDLDGPDPDRHKAAAAAHIISAQTVLPVGDSIAVTDIRPA